MDNVTHPLEFLIFRRFHDLKWKKELFATHCVTHLLGVVFFSIFYIAAHRNAQTHTECNASAEVFVFVCLSTTTCNRKVEVADTCTM